jgi:hypothetical protein
MPFATRKFGGSQGLRSPQFRQHNCCETPQSERKSATLVADYPSQQGTGETAMATRRARLSTDHADRAGRGFVAWIVIYAAFMVCLIVFQAELMPDLAMAGLAVN